MFEIQGFFRTGFFAAASVGLGSAAISGDGNQIYILQQNPAGIASGNTLEVDQSNATNSLIAGSFATNTSLLGTGLLGIGLNPALSPAVQDGVNNVGQITISGTGGQVVFLQTGTDNSATVTLSSALGMAMLEQNGTNNTATLTVDPLAIRGDIQQFGKNNLADLTVSGKGASGALVQKGDNNQFGFTVTGTNTTASYTAIGNNMAPAGTGPVVISNGGAVTITQTQF